MRKIDKSLNIKKVNRLIESLYFEDKQKVDELDMQSYASAMDNTEMFPWTNFMSNQSNDPKFLGNKRARVNALARERFTTEFYKVYPVGTKILTNDGVYAFNHLKFTTNYTSYYLVFNDNENTTITLSADKSAKNGIYIDGLISDTIIEIQPESIPLVQDMLKYNLSTK